MPGITRPRPAQADPPRSPAVSSSGIAQLAMHTARTGWPVRAEAASGRPRHDQRESARILVSSCKISKQAAAFVVTQRLQVDPGRPRHLPAAQPDHRLARTVTARSARASRTSTWPVGTVTSRSSRSAPAARDRETEHRAALRLPRRQIKHSGLQVASAGEHQRQPGRFGPLKAPHCGGEQRVELRRAQRPIDGGQCARGTQPGAAS